MGTKVPKEDVSIGMEVYATATSPLNGLIKRRVEDFIVTEELNKDFLADLRRDKSTTHKFPIYWSRRMGMGTIAFCRYMSRRLGKSPSKLRLLGLKDARAISNQIMGINSSTTHSYGKDDHMRFLGWSRRLPSRRDLVSNNFEILISEIHKEPVEVKRIVHGFTFYIDSIPNFYGYQRFGSKRRVTHLVGEKILKGRYEEAIWLYLTHTSSHEDQETRLWRYTLDETGDLSMSFKEIPLRLFYEKRMISALLRHKDDYMGAIRKLPITLRRLLVNAYQSYLFNKILSKRIKEGLPINRPSKGDFMRTVDGSISVYSNKNPRIPRLLLPTFGLGYIRSRGRQGKLEEELLREADLSPKSFYVKEMPELNCRSDMRAACILPDRFTTEYVVKANEMTVHFALEKGSYATVFLRELIKPSNPHLQGF